MGHGGQFDDPTAATLAERACTLAIRAAGAALPSIGDARTLGSDTLDPDAEKFMRLARRSRPKADADVAAHRRELDRAAALIPRPKTPVTTWDRTIPGDEGPLRARVYRPHWVTGPATTVVYFHGGGWVTGGIASHDAACRRLAALTSAQVVSVEYRLAPEHRAPAASLDAIAAYRWAANDGAHAGIDPTRVAVAGDSAGGNLAAIVAQQCRTDEHPPIAQLLVYPGLDCTLELVRSSPARDAYPLNLGGMEWFLDQYLPADADPTDPIVSPMFATELGDLAPGVMAIAAFDPLREECHRYTELVRRAGGEMELLRFGGLSHSFYGLGVLPAWRNATAAINRAFAALLHR